MFSVVWLNIKFLQHSLVQKRLRVYTPRYQLGHRKTSSTDTRCCSRSRTARVWMFGRWGDLCGPRTLRCLIVLTPFEKVFELATSHPLIGYAHEELNALHELTSSPGPIPQEWVSSLGARS